MFSSWLKYHLLFFVFFLLILMSSYYTPRGLCWSFFFSFCRIRMQWRLIDCYDDYISIACNCWFNFPKICIAEIYATVCGSRAFCSWHGYISFYFLFMVSLKMLLHNELYRYDVYFVYQGLWHVVLLTIELCLYYLFQAIATVVSVAEILKNNGFAIERSKLPFCVHFIIT